MDPAIQELVLHMRAAQWSHRANDIQNDQLDNYQGAKSEGGYFGKVSVPS